MSISIVIVFMMLMGVLKIIISTSSIYKKRNHFIKGLLPGKLFGDSLLPGIIAEYLVAFSLLGGAITLYLGFYNWLILALLGLVAMIYLALLGFSGRIEEKESAILGTLNIIGFIGGAVSIIILILKFQ